MKTNLLKKIRKNINLYYTPSEKTYIISKTFKHRTLLAMGLRKHTIIDMYAWNEEQGEYKLTIEELKTYALNCYREELIEAAKYYQKPKSIKIK